ncbi:P-loop containing nucleoside triphosphate hydrolase protein, partial [Atractiella rhizophila]
MFLLFMRHPLLTTPSGLEAISTSPTMLLPLFRILHSLPSFPLSFISRTSPESSPSWTLPKFVTELMKTSPHRGTRILAWHCVKRWRGWTAGRGVEERKKWICQDEFVPIPQEDANEDYIDWDETVMQQDLSSGGSLRTHRVRIDAWVADYAEWERIQFHSKRGEKVEEQDIMEVDSSALELRHEDLCHLVRILHGRIVMNERYLSPSKSQEMSPPDFIVSSSALQLLPHISSSLKTRHPMLFSLPSSSHLDVPQLLCRVAHHVGAQPPIVIDFSDKTMDGRSLLGGYSSSSNPENEELFSFHMGTLAAALQSGRWVIFTALDKLVPMGSVESVIRELTERIHFRSKDWKVGGAWGGWGHEAGAGMWTESGMRGSWIGAHEGFMLFGVCQEDKRWIGKEYWSNAVAVPPFEQKELDDLVIAKLGDFPWVLDCMRVWREMGIATGIDGLMKWVARLKTLHSCTSFTSLGSNPVLQDHIFLDALDLFFSANEKTEEMSMLFRLGSILGINKDRVEWIVSSRKPEVVKNDVATDAFGVESSIENSFLEVGRSRLPCKSRHKAPASRPFALTRPSRLLLERVASCVLSNEPVLLVGETGTGKTTAVAHLAEHVGKKLIVVNLSKQTEPADLIGGLKPVDGDVVKNVKVEAAALVNRFISLFTSTFDTAKNAKFIGSVKETFEKHRYSRLVKLWHEASKTAFAQLPSRVARSKLSEQLAESPHKKRKLDHDQSLKAWENFVEDVDAFDLAFVKKKKVHPASSSPFKFSFIDGPLVTALKEGHWILLDEVNLASFETLEVIAPILQFPTSSITLTEMGEVDSVFRHPEFRIFACMNPATDVGKKDLPQVMKNRFTRFWVDPPDADRDSLISIVHEYISKTSSVTDRAVEFDAAELYTSLRKLAKNAELADGSNQPPHFSMRTLARALAFAAENASVYPLRRSLYEGTSSVQPKIHRLS